MINWIIETCNIFNFFCSGSQIINHVDVLKNYVKLTKKQYCLGLFLIKLQASYFHPATFIKKKISAQVVSYEIGKIHIRRCFEIYTTKNKSLFDKVGGLQFTALSKNRVRNSCFHVIKNTFFCRAPSDDFFWVLLKTVPIAIPNAISKNYYQKGFVICFVISTYGRFLEFPIETL